MEQSYFESINSIVINSIVNNSPAINATVLTSALISSYFVSGSNQVISLQLLRLLPNRPDIIAFAGVRNPSKGSKTGDHSMFISSSLIHHLRSMPKQQFVQGRMLQVVSTSLSPTLELGRKLTLSIVVFDPLSSSPVLLKRQTRKYFTISGLVGVVTDMLDAPKTAQQSYHNFVTKGIHLKHSPAGFIAFSMHPEISTRIWDSQLLSRLD